MVYRKLCAANLYCRVAPSKGPLESDAQKKEDDAMAQTVTPSDITSGQIGKIQEILGAGLRKAGLPSDAVQQVIEHRGDELVGELVDTVRRYTEAYIGMIVRRVRVDRTRTPQATLDATERKPYANHDVVATMPRGEGEEVDVYFLHLGRYLSNEEQDWELERLGFKPADSYSLAAVNEADPIFADTHPNATHWKDANGKWCYFACSRWRGGRYVDVDRRDFNWDDDWWFAGLRK